MNVRFSLTLSLLVAATTFACDPAAPNDPAPTEAAGLALRGLDGVAYPIVTDTIARDADGVRWSGTVGADEYVVQLDDARLVVTDADGRALFAVTDGEGGIELAGWTGGAPFEATLARPAEVPAQSPALAIVDDALAFPPTDDAAGFFAPLVDADNVIAAPLALVALPVLLDGLGAEAALGDGLAQRKQAMLPYLVGGAVAGGALGAAYCLRSSTSASCDLGNGTSVAITCNACQGTASCTRTVSGGRAGGILQAEDEGSDGGTQTVTCTCACR